MDLNHLYTNVYRHWIDYLRNNLSDALKYHSVNHTLDVLEYCKQIAKAEGVDGEDLLLLKIAAVFHDSGFLESPNEHEKRGCNIAEDYLAERGLKNGQLQEIRQMIMATKIPQSPKSKLGEILCDADLAYIGTDRYNDISSKLFEEITLLGSYLSEKEWIKLQISFLKQHNFFTSYAQRTFTKTKQKHIKTLEDQFNK